jgi:hypothetical protein
VEKDDITSFTCESIGVAGTTRVVLKPVGDEWIARVGVAIMGCTNRPVEELATADPFDMDFHDNFAQGRGKTKEEALQALKDDIAELSKGLFL